MNIKDIEKMEKAVKILHPYQYDYLYYPQGISFKEEKEANRMYDEKVLYYIRAGVNPDQLLKNALKFKADQIKKIKLADIEREKQVEEYKKKKKEEQKNCRHEWRYYIKNKTGENCYILEGPKLFKRSNWAICKQCQLEKSI